MNAEDDARTQFDFLAGGGEMGERMRTHDWSTSVLGPLENWPQELQVAVGIMLTSRHPMCLVWGAHLGFLYNDTYSPFLGARHPRALGRPIEEVWADVWNDIAPLIARAMSGESVWLEDMYLMMLRNGYPEDTWWTFCYSPLRAADGSVSGMLNVCTDSTAKVYAERARRETEARQAFLLKLSDALRPLVDPLAVQETATRLLGEELAASRAMYVEVKEEHGRRQYVVERNYLAPGVTAPVIGNFTAVDYGHSLVEESQAGRTMVVADIDREPRLASREREAFRALGVKAFIATPLLKKGKWVAAIAVHFLEPRDWTRAEATLVEDVAERTWAVVERVRADQALHQSEAALRAADRRKDEFLAMLAHELRNPLAPIRNGVRILEEGTDPARITPVSMMMQRQVDHMVRLIDDLLDVSRVSLGKIELRRVRCDVDATVRLAVEANRSLCESFGHELTLTLPARSIYVNADVTRLAQIIGNLLNNACKFTNRGGRISLSVQQDAYQAVIRVRDTGIGMTAEQIPHVFDLFAQADTSLERTESGLGIGLTLVKRLVEMHGGTVSASSLGLGQGSEFMVRLPALIEEHSAAVPETLWSGKPTVPRRVLIVDDSVDSAESLAMLLMLDGHKTTCAHDGCAAVEVATGPFAPEVVLLDIGLPGMNGYEVARALRARRGESLTLIALTGWGQQDDRARSREAGFNAHLVKPVDYDALRLLLANEPGAVVTLQ